MISNEPLKERSTPFSGTNAGMRSEEVAGSVSIIKNAVPSPIKVALSESFNSMSVRFGDRPTLHPNPTDGYPAANSSYVCCLVQSLYVFISLFLNGYPAANARVLPHLRQQGPA